MNLLKQSSPGQQGTQSSMFADRLTTSPHYKGASIPGSPPTTHLGTPSSLLLQMGGENSAFKALVPNSLHQDNLRRLSDYASDSEEEINVNDESDIEESNPRTFRTRSRSSSPVEVVDVSNKESVVCQPLQLTMHDREWTLVVWFSNCVYFFLTLSTKGF